MRGRLVYILFLTLLSADASVAQLFKAFAFGDSVTKAVLFDDERPATCDPTSPTVDQNFCGYSVRLSEADYYACEAETCFFDNRGQGGESTVAGLTRIDQELGNKEWDLVTIMEGTNDILEISVESIAFNLGEMAAKVEARSAAAALASIISFKPSFARPELGELNAESDRLRDRLAVQAQANKRCFVDVRSRLCPPDSNRAACLLQNYWTPPAGVLDAVGHVNSKGYEIMTDEFFSVLGAVGPPGAAEPTAPIEAEVCSADLVLEWKKESVADSSCGNWYNVEIDGSRRTEFSGWVSENDACSGKSCAWAPPVNLGRGDYSFRVMTRNTAGFGPPTDDVLFSALRNPPDAVRNVIGPSGTVFPVGGTRQRFEWGAVKDARTYRLELVSGKGRVVLEESVAAADACSGSTCSFTPTEALEADRYTWRIQAENVCGGVFSQPVIFELFGGPPAAPPPLAGPEGRVYDPSPSYRWETVPGATEYEVQLPSGGVVTVVAASACVGGVCRLQAGGLAPGFYNWRVRGVNPLGGGAWSALTAFEVAFCNCARASTAGGASVLMAVPEPWNGDLVLWAPASNAFGVREITDLGPLADRLFDAGYGLATTSYSVAGWPVFKSKRDLEKLLKQFQQRYGEPTRVFLIGESVGALVASLGLEKARLGNVAGAMTLCGPTDVDSTWEAALDLRLAYDAVCAEQPGTAIPGGAMGLTDDHGLEPADIEAALGLCTGLSKQSGNRSKAQRRRLDELLGVTALAEEGLGEAMELATFGLYDLVSDKKKLRGGVPVGNLGVVYSSVEVDATIQRFAADGKAKRKLARFSDLSGKVGEARIVSLHTSSDPVFFVQNQTSFSELLPPENLVTAIAVEDESSRCALSDVELLTGWQALVDWVDGGEQPTVNEMERQCDRLRSTADGECRFDSDYALTPMATRVAPRP